MVYNGEALKELGASTWRSDLPLHKLRKKPTVSGKRHFIVKPGVLPELTAASKDGGGVFKKKHLVHSSMEGMCCYQRPFWLSPWKS